MDNIVVCDLYRLGKNGDKFSKEFKTLIRKGAKINESYVNGRNANWSVNGQWYEVDEKATEERNKASKSNPSVKKEVDEEREVLKSLADSYNLSYPKNIKKEKLQDLITEHENKLK